MTGSPCARCNHPEETHAQATLFAPARCLHHEWWDKALTCDCEGYLSIEAAEREAIQGETR